MDPLRGRNAVLTGASRGIGVHIARALAAEGVNLVLSARSQAPIELLAEELGASGIRAVAVTADVGRAADRAALLARSEAEFGNIDILINNAALEDNGGFVDFAPEHIDYMLQVDLVAPMLLTRAVLPAMLARRSGHVVNIASVAGKCATPYNVPYSAAKGGLVLFTQSLGAELEGSGVSASVIVPGYVSEAGMMAEKIRDHAVAVPLLVGASPPEAVARAVVRALRKDRLEIVVAHPLMKLVQACNQLFPEAVTWFNKRIGAFEPFRKVAKSPRAQ
jgi:short-subunit dehydrogenase